MIRWQDRHTVIPAVFMVFHKDNQVLLMRRAGSNYLNGWFALPAGHVDGNESAIDAACREAKEEVGLTIKPEDLHLVHTMHEMAEGHERINLAFDVLRYDGAPQIAEPNKCTELLWISPTQLPEQTVPSTRQFIEQILKSSPYSSFRF